MPQRIQLRRIKGWRKPEGAINVARPTMWGNPWRMDFAAIIGPGMDHVAYLTPEAAQDISVDLYRAWLTNRWPGMLAADMAPRWTTPELSARRRNILDRLPKLRGHDLACWCAIGNDFYGDPIRCHADVLLELANA